MGRPRRIDAVAHLAYLSRRLGPWRVGIILALGSALAFACMGPFAKLAYERGVSVTGMLAARFLVGSAFWLAWLGPRLKTIRWRSRATAWAIAAGGVGGGVAGLAEFGAYRLLPVALVLVLLFINPIWLMILERVLHGRRVGLWGLVATAFVLGGLVLLLGVSTSRTSVVGLGLALLASVTATVLFLGIQESVRHHGPSITSGLVVWSAVPVALGVALGHGSLGTVVEGAPQALLALALGVLSSVVGIRLLVSSVGRIGAFNSAVVSATEVVIGATIAWILLAEVLNPPQILGGILIMLGTVIVDQKRTLQSERHEEAEDGSIP